MGKLRTREISKMIDFRIGDNELYLRQMQKRALKTKCVAYKCLRRFMLGVIITNRTNTMYALGQSYRQTKAPISTIPEPSHDWKSNCLLHSY